MFFSFPVLFGAISTDPSLVVKRAFGAQEAQILMKKSGLLENSKTGERSLLRTKEQRRKGQKSREIALSWGLTCVFGKSQGEMLYAPPFPFGQKALLGGREGGV